MSIIVRKNKHSARILRQEYVRKNSEGNLHGFVRQVPLATISLSATEVPVHIAELLTSKELERLKRAVVVPAQAALERRMKEEETRERDPGWRVVSAIRYLEEAAERSLHIPVDRNLLTKLHQTVSFLGPVAATTVDPLATVADAARVAIAAIEAGAYGRNDGPVRKDALPATKWTELRAVVLDDERSLLAVLQESGWVVKRERAAR